MSQAALAKRTCGECGASDWGSRNRCKPCQARASRERWASNPDVERAKRRGWKRAWRAANPDAERAASRRQRYGLSAEAFAALLGAQGGVCRICRRPDPDCVDHSHETGRIRGLLCLTCNAGLGHFRDDPHVMRAAAAYLVRSR